MLMALMMGASTVFAQGWGRGYGEVNGNFGHGPGYCVNFLPDLTEEQIEQITEREITHQKAMAELRVKQRSAVDLEENMEIREQMLERVQAHRDEVHGLLTEEQQKQYDLLQNRRNYADGRFYRGRRGGPRGGAFRGRCGRGYGFGRRGNFAGNGRGYGCPWYQNNPAPDASGEED